MSGPAIGDRKRVNGKGLHVLEYEYHPEVPAARGQRVVFGGGKIGHADHGDGWLRIYGDGLYYDYIGMRTDE